MQINSYPNYKSPLNIRVQKLAVLSQGHVLWRRPSCGRWCHRLGVPTVCVDIMSWCCAAEKGCIWVPALLQELGEQCCANRGDAGAKLGGSYYSAELIH